MSKTTAPSSAATQRENGNGNSLRIDESVKSQSYIYYFFVCNTTAYKSNAIAVNNNDSL